MLLCFGKADNRMSDLLNKKKSKNSLSDLQAKIEPESAFDRQKLFSGKEITKKKDD